jgi:UDPglucose 6-dehydrogenase
MRLTIFGSGYVGLVTGACMAEMGNHVVCVDIDEDKIEKLNRGELPIYEPGLDAYVERNAEAGRLEFTTDVQKGVDHGLFQIISVGTPPD